MSILRYLVVLSLAVIVLGKPLNYKKVVYAVDCGSNQPYKSSIGFTYQPDRGYSENTKVADYSTNSEIAAATIRYTHDQQVYMTERHADDTFYYDIPVNSPGKYVLISKFAENWLRSPKVRIFNIMFGSCMGESGVDIYEKVGRFAAYDSYIEFELKNNNIYVNQQACSGAYINGKLRVSYTKIGFDNPKVDAIMLYQGDLAETDFAELVTMRRDWDKRMKDETRRREEERLRKEEARLKRREKIRPRNDEFEDFGDEFEETDVTYTATKSIADQLGDYLALIVVLAIGSGVVYFLSRKGDSGQITFDTGVDDSSKEEKKDKKDKGAAKKQKKN